MSRPRFRLLPLALAAALGATAANAQGFLGLGAPSVTGFAVPDPETRFDFPADHGAHPMFRLEWWYLTSNLTDASGAPLGLQWTLFRTATAPRDGADWAAPQIWFGHAAVTTAEDHVWSERWARGGVGQAGVETDPFSAWIDDWKMESRATGDADALSSLTLSASGTGFAYDLTLDATGPLVAHGAEGYSVKSEAGQASHYYSQPFYEVTGTVTFEDDVREVTGQAWLDREWSSQPLTADQTGWDWFSLHLDGGAKLMGYRLRSADGSSYDVGTWIDPDGTATPLEPGAFAAEPLEEAEVAGRDIPVRWRLTLPERDLDVTVAALNPQSWMAAQFSYWEGPISIEGTHTGRGYMELTGYE